MLYPIFVNLQGKLCVVVGAGPVAEKRTIGLLRQGAEVRLVAPDATAVLSSLAETGSVAWMRERYKQEHVEDAFLVIAATNNHEVNKTVASDANQKNILICCADDPAGGNYITGSVMERGDLIVSLTTSGASPTLSSVLKARLEAEFGAEWGRWTCLFASLRGSIQRLPGETDRRSMVERILSDENVGRLIEADQTELAEEAARQCILSHSV